MKLLLVFAAFLGFAQAQAATAVYHAHGTAALYYPFPGPMLNAMNMDLDIEVFADDLSYSQKKGWKLGFIHMGGETIAVDIEPVKNGMRLHLGTLSFSRMVHILLTNSTTSSRALARAEKLYADCFYNYIVSEGGFYPCGFERKGMAIKSFNDDYVYEFSTKMRDYSGFFRNKAGVRDHLSLVLSLN